MKRLKNKSSLNGSMRKWNALRMMFLFRNRKEIIEEKNLENLVFSPLRNDMGDLKICHARLQDTRLVLQTVQIITKGVLFIGIPPLLNRIHLFRAFPFLQCAFFRFGRKQLPLHRLLFYYILLPHKICPLPFCVSLRL